MRSNEDLLKTIKNIRSYAICSQDTDDMDDRYLYAERIEGICDRLIVDLLEVTQ